MQRRDSEGYTAYSMLISESHTQGNADWNAAITGMKDFERRWSKPLPHPKSTITFIERSRQPCKILQAVGRTTTAHELHFIHG